MGADVYDAVPVLLMVSVYSCKNADAGLEKRESYSDDCVYFPRDADSLLFLYLCGVIDNFHVPLSDFPKKGTRAFKIYLLRSRGNCVLVDFLSVGFVSYFFKQSAETFEDRDVVAGKGKRISDFS